jgi:hypothetical protein
MAVEKDQSAWLPEPPPPRPARRDAAIEAALRKFDDVEEPAPARWAARPSWASAHRPQLVMIVSAMLLVIVGIPAALIGLRNPPEKAPPPVAAFEKEAPPQRVVPQAQPAPATPPPLVQMAPPPPRPRSEPAVRNFQGADGAPAVSSETVTQSLPAVPPVVAAPPAPAPSPVIAAAPPAPPPPPPPPPPASANRQATAEGIADNLLVTGSRIPKPALEAPAPAKVLSPDQSYRRFLSALQSAVRSGNRGAVIALIGFPLRVNFASGARTYRDARSVERDFERIFTPKVKRAIAAQRAEQLFTRDQGAMVGSGELWFRESCANTDCSRTGPVRIVAVNP